MNKGNGRRMRILKKSMAAMLGLSLALTGIPEQGLFAKAEHATENKEERTDVMVVQNAAATDIKNVIYMVPDGGGFPSYDIAKAVKEAGGINYGGTKQTANKMYLDEYLIGNITTHPAEGKSTTTDSAAGGTALACGNKTFMGMVGLNTDGKPMANILEMCQMQDKATGIIVNSYTADATPADFAAHTSSRTEYKQIIKQMASQNINLVWGGCVKQRCSMGKFEEPEKKGYTCVSDKSSLKSEAEKTYEDPSSELKLWADFAKGSEYQIAYDIGYGKNYDGYDDGDRHTPTMAEMMDNAIKLLSQDQDGFFLMMEGSKIDYANHHGNMVESVGEWIAFDEAFKVALDFAEKREDTMIVVAPDHNTGLTETPDSSKMGSVVSKVQNQDSEGAKKYLSFYVKQDGSENDHTPMNGGLWMYLPNGVPIFEETMSVDKNNSMRGYFTSDNTDVANYIATVIADNTVKSLSDATNKLFYDVSNMGSYDEKSETFRFNDYDASVLLNTDELIVDGNSENSRGEISIHCPIKDKEGKTIGHKVYISKYAYQLVTGQVLEEEELNKLEGEGTKEDPYRITSADDFVKFTENMKNNNIYKGAYFKQTANIDLSEKTGYIGIGSESEFKGIYDGQGYTITVNIESDSNKGTAVFPYTSGVIKNLGTIGSIENTAQDGGCAGIVRSIRPGGKIYNCWSTVDLKSKKDVGAIALSVNENAFMCNCYYKGNVSTINNYGVAMHRNNATIENCYYQMEAHSSSLASEMVGGKLTDNFSASRLNGYQDTAKNTLGLESTEELCKFMDAIEQDFAFEGSIAKLAKLTFSYTCKDGNTKEEEITNLNRDRIGYDASIGKEMNANEPIKLTGIATEDSVDAEIVDGEATLDNKGYGIGVVLITSSVKNDYYETSTTTRYSVSFMGPKAGEEEEATPTPIPTETPSPSIAPTATVTTQPTQEVKKTPIPTPIVTKVPPTPEVTPKITPKITPKVTPTVKPTLQPTPAVPTNSGIQATEKPVATATPAISMDSCDVLDYSSVYIFTNKKIAPNVTVLYNDKVLKPGTDYLVEYKKNVNVGTASIVLIGMGNYTGTKTVNFKIKAKSVKALKVSQLKAKVSKKNKMKLSFTMKYGTYKLRSKRDFALTYKKNIQKKIVTVTIKGKGNFTGQKKVKFKLK